jgi:hypothetical protein
VIMTSTIIVVILAIWSHAKKTIINKKLKV